LGTGSPAGSIRPQGQEHDFTLSVIADTAGSNRPNWLQQWFCDALVEPDLVLARGRLCFALCRAPQQSVTAHRPAATWIDLNLPRASDDI